MHGRRGPRWRQSPAVCRRPAPSTAARAEWSAASQAAPRLVRGTRHPPAPTPVCFSEPCLRARRAWRRPILPRPQPTTLPHQRRRGCCWRSRRRRRSWSCCSSGRRPSAASASPTSTATTTAAKVHTFPTNFRPIFRLTFRPSFG